ncbi:uncharacterized protein LOC128652414 [Bombina bombina]|uniref:uncharacterized protein LOC128652414 n=1 Tax=Bombina bombina TaxID=8345 RepID=UPI00235AA64C|nr:uncharacterized protein LOC128652414 [Bombina bombina]
MEALLQELLSAARRNGEGWIRQQLSTAGEAATTGPVVEAAVGSGRRPARRSRPPERLSPEVGRRRSGRERSQPAGPQEQARSETGRGQRTGAGAEARPRAAPGSDVITARQRAETGTSRGRGRAGRTGRSARESGVTRGELRVEAQDASGRGTPTQQDRFTEPPLELNASGDFPDEEEDPLEGTSAGPVTASQEPVAGGRTGRRDTRPDRTATSGVRRRSRSPRRRTRGGGSPASPTWARVDRSRDRSRYGRGRSPARREAVRRRLDVSRGREEVDRDRGRGEEARPVREEGAGTVQQPAGEVAGGAPCVNVAVPGEREAMVSGLRALLASLENPGRGTSVAAAWTTPGLTPAVGGPQVAAASLETPASNGGEVVRVPESALRRPCLCSVGPLGIHLTGELREKIGKREFIEIFSLLPLEHVLEVKEDEKEKGKKEEEERKKRWRKLPKTFINWSRAFRILASVICEKTPDQGASLFCYYDEISSAYGTYGGMAWWRYDEGFRQRLAVRPEMRWDDRDMSIWLEMMTPLRGGHSFRGPGQTPGGGVPGGSGPALRKGVCFQFNDGQCKFGASCKYKHECSGCGGVHPFAKCFKKGKQGSRSGDVGSSGADAGEGRKDGPMVRGLRQ